MEHQQTHQTAASPSTGSSPSAGNSRNTKLDHIIQNFYTKAAQVIVQARLTSESDKYGTSASGKEGRSGRDSLSRKINKWFNIATEDVDFLREDLKYWRMLAIHAIDKEPPPMRIDIYLDTSGLTDNQTLVVADDNMRWNRVNLGFNQSESSSSINRILLETWVLTLQPPLPNYPVDLPNLYKRSIVFFRALHSLVRLLPVHTLSRRQVTTRSHDRLQIGARLTPDVLVKDDEVDLETSILDGDARHPTKQYEFSDVVTPLGTFKLQVQYRRNCDFKVEESERDMSARFIDMDEHYFTPTMAKYQQEKPTHHRSRSRPMSMYDGLRTVKSMDTSVAVQAAPSTSTPTSASRRLSNDSSSPRQILHQQQRRQSLIASRGSPLINDYTSMENLTDSGSRRASAPFVSPFKSPSLSSSPQADAFLSSSRISSVSSERPKIIGADSGSSSRKVEFSSSFEKYKDRGSPSRIDSGSISMTRRWSHASDHSSINALNETEDADLEDFMRFVGAKQDLKIFQGRNTSQLEESTNISPPSEAGSSMNASAFGSSGSIHRSKRALSHFQNLRDTHASLSESLASSMVAGQQERSEPVPLAGASPGSSSSSTGRSYQPFVPSPLHVEQHSVSMPIPHNIQISHAYSHATQDSHRRHRSSQHDGRTNEKLSPDTPAFSSYPQDVTDLRRLRQISSPLTTRRRLDSNDMEISPPHEGRHRHASEGSLHDGGGGSSSIAAAGASSNISREGGRTSVIDDDDSLVFKMSELGCEGSPQPVQNETAAADSTASVMMFNRQAYKYSGYLKDGENKPPGLRRASSSGDLSHHTRQDELRQAPASPSKSEPGSKDQDPVFEGDS